jgi:hypothetical protein
LKKLAAIISAVLAMNFVVVAAGVGYLVQQKRLDREKVYAIRDLLFPPPQPQQPPAEVAADPSPLAPTLRLEELLSRSAGRSTSEQVEFIQHSFDAQMAQLDRRERELIDLHRQVDLAKAQMARDRRLLESQKKLLDENQQQMQQLATDEGFQDTLTLYSSMTGKQVKAIFLTLDDATVARYLQAMQPRVAARVIKEFKTPDEIARIQRVLEMMRQAQASAKE